jgi:hypothetical protein
MLKRALILIGLIFTLAGCGQGNNDAAATPDVQSVVGLVNWNHDPYQVVFRAETVGGDNTDALYRLNDVPACTIYGDGRVVWTEQSMSGGVPTVLFDVLTEERVTSFALYLSVELRFLTYTEEYPNEIPGSSDPVYEKMTLAINDVTHVTDAFSTWPDQYYDIVLEACQKLAITPRKFEPDAGWLSAQMVTYNASVPSIIWDAAAAGFSFNEVSATQEKRWMEGNLVKILWRAMYDNSFDIQFDENGIVYQIALQVPGVTRDAPPAPAQ